MVTSRGERPHPIHGLKLKPPRTIRRERLARPPLAHSLTLGLLSDGRSGPAPQALGELIASRWTLMVRICW